MRKFGWFLGALAISVLTLVIARQFLVYLPADHFCAHGRASVSRLRRTAQRFLGAFLITLGAVLAIPGVPGQGLLLVLIGLILLDVPILRRLELRLLRVRLVSEAVNRMRINAGQLPLQLPEGPARPHDDA